MAQIIETEYFSAQLIQELVTAAADQEGLVKRKEVEPTLPLVSLFKAFETACRGALEEVLEGQYYHLKEEYTITDLMEADGPFLMLMTLEGQGVGIWDGSWDEYFTNPEPIIEHISHHIKNRLSFFADGTGGGVIPEQLLASARVSVGLSAYGEEKDKVQNKGHRCPVCGCLYENEAFERPFLCTKCNYAVPEEILSHYM